MQASKAIEFQSKVSKARAACIELRRDYFRAIKSDKPAEIYFSTHFFERLVERNLLKDVNFAMKIVLMFHRDVFSQSTFQSRKFLVQLGSLKVAIDISPNWKFHDDRETHTNRHMVVKTIFEDDRYFVCDEVIKL